MRYLITFLTAILLFTACQKTQTPTASENAKRYPFKGKIISVDKTKKKAKIEHEEVKGFMEPMTMDFPIHEDWVWDDLVPGVELEAELVVDNAGKDPYWLEKIRISAAPNANVQVPPINENFAQIGKEVPAFSLTNQDGKKFTLQDYRGKATAITFIYAQCPLPDACIKMSTHFSDLALKLKDDAEAKDKIRLLSVSFDPARDTPEKLKQYGQGYLGKDAKPDFTLWQLAVGNDQEIKSIADFFGVRYQVDEQDKTQFTHSLITAVISPEGKVTKIMKGTDWSPDDLLQELKASIK